MTDPLDDDVRAVEFRVADGRAACDLIDAVVDDAIVTGAG